MRLESIEIHVMACETSILCLFKEAMILLGTTPHSMHALKYATKLYEETVGKFSKTQTRSWIRLEQVSSTVDVPPRA